MADPSGWADDLDRPMPSTRNVLTAEEIDALLRPNLPDDLPVPPEPQSVTLRPATVFDEASDEAANNALREGFASLGARLSLSLAQGTGIKAALTLQACADASPSDVTLNVSGKIGAIACFGRADHGAEAAIFLSPELADAVIAQACGAKGSTGRIGDGWTLSAIDCALLEQLLSGFSNVFNSGASLQAIETDMAYVMSLMPAETLQYAEYRLEAAGLHTSVFMVRAPEQEPGQRQAVETPLSGAPLGAPVTAVVTARVASLSVPLSRLTSLKAGSTLLLGLPADQPVEVLSGGRDGPVAFEGEIGRKGNHMAVRINSRRRSVLK